MEVPRNTARRHSAKLFNPAGDTIVEVLIAAAVLVIVVVAIYTTLNIGLTSSATERYRVQADYVAQENEEKLQADSLQTLQNLSGTHSTVTVQNTQYTVATTIHAVAATTGSSTCTSGTTTADYYQTTSSVTWPTIGSASPVVETGQVSPPSVAASLVAAVTEAKGEGVSGVAITATGPSPETTKNAATTGEDGCASYLGLTAGTYALNATRSGYVTPNGYSNTSQDSAAQQSATLVKGTTTKAAYELAPGATLALKATTTPNLTESSEPEPTQLAQALIFNTGITLPSYRVFGTAGTYTNALTTPATVFPFASPYTVYAGACTANEPTKNNSAITDPSVTVTAGKTANLTLQLPALIVLVYSGTSSNKGTLVSSPVVVITDTDSGTGCDTTKHTLTTVAAPTLKQGALSYPGQPYGTYTVCTTVSGKHYSVTGVRNNNPTTGTTVTLYQGSTALSSGEC